MTKQTQEQNITHTSHQLCQLCYIRLRICLKRELRVSESPVKFAVDMSVLINRITLCSHEHVIRYDRKICVRDLSCGHRLPRTPCCLTDGFIHRSLRPDCLDYMSVRPEQR